MDMDLFNNLFEGDTCQVWHKVVFSAIVDAPFLIFEFACGQILLPWWESLQVTSRRQG